jgi:hypothetical protein
VRFHVPGKAFEPTFQRSAVGVDPARYILQLGWPELALAGSSDLGRDHEMDLFEDPDMLLDPVEG